MPETLPQPTVESNAQIFRGVVPMPVENVSEETPPDISRPYEPQHRAAETVGLRERFTRSGFGRTALRVAMAAGLVVGPVLVEAAPAAADSQEYTITDAAAGGYFLRNSPHMNDTPRIDGQGVYPGDKVRLICGVTNGDAVGPYNNRTWHKIVKESRPDLGEFWENDHLFDTPNKANELAPGERNCNDTAPSASNPASDVKGCYYNMKAPSTNLTFSYSGDHRYYGNAWQAARDWSDLGAGVTIKPGNGSTYIRFKDVYHTNQKPEYYGNADVPRVRDWIGPLASPPTHPHVPSHVTIEV